MENVNIKNFLLSGRQSAPDLFFSNSTDKIYMDRLFQLSFKNNNHERHIEIINLVKTLIDEEKKNIIFVCCCKYGKIDLAKLIIEEENMNFNYNEAFFESCKHGQYEVCKWLYKIKGKEINEIPQKSFSNACINGNLKLVKWLINNYNINIHENNEYAFRWSCASNNLDVAKFLYFSGANIFTFDENGESHMTYDHNDGILDIYDYEYISDSVNFYNDDYLIGAFELSCVCKSIDVAKWLTCISDNYNVTIVNNKITNWKKLDIDTMIENREHEKVIKNIGIKKNIEQENIDCFICFDNTCPYMLKTKCNHTFCLHKLYVWTKKNKTCPLCRAHIFLHDCILIKI